jgi:hypothetical protein
MTPYEIIRKAIPGASDGLCEHVLWGRTPFPCGAITARSLYSAARRVKRAADHGHELCDLCDNVVTGDGFACDSCLSILEQCRKERDEVNP